MDLFTDYAAREAQEQADKAGPCPGAEAPGGHAGHQETVRQERHPLKGMNLEDGATAKERNQTIGGHQA